MKNILIFVTNHATLGPDAEANGTYAPEITHAVHVFKENEYGYTIASIEGGNAPLYGTETPDDSVNTEILADADFSAKITATEKASEVDLSGYDAIFYPGGFGLLYDLAENKEVAQLSAQHYENGGLIGAVCHGPAALLPITLSNGDSLLSSKTVTGFTREEEVDFGTISKIPYLLEESLTRKAKRYEKTQPWTDNTIVDGRLITGQNPASATSVAKEMVKALS